MTSTSLPTLLLPKSKGSDSSNIKDTWPLIHKAALLLFHQPLHYSQKDHGFLEEFFLSKPAKLPQGHCQMWKCSLRRPLLDLILEPPSILSNPIKMRKLKFKEKGDRPKASPSIKGRGRVKSPPTSHSLILLFSLTKSSISLPKSLSSPSVSSWHFSLQHF